MVFFFIYFFILLKQSIKGMKSLCLWYNKIYYGNRVFTIAHLLLSVFQLVTAEKYSCRCNLVGSVLANQT